MLGLFQGLSAMLAAGQDALLVSILAESGSAPRGVGAHMLVGQNGRLWGSIGGGNIEHQSIQLAGQLLQERRSLLKQYHLSRDLGMICGGEATVFYQYISPDEPHIKELCAAALHQMEQNRDVWLITLLPHSGAWQMGIYSREEGLLNLSLDMGDLQAGLKQHPVCLHSAGAACYVQPIASAGRVLIFGGGHVAQALLPLLAKLEFNCWLMDDRPEFANTKLFPEAKKVICCSYEDIGRLIKISPADFVVIMTHGHISDYTVQKQAMQAQPAYIGVIGSRNKVRSINGRLASEGFTAAEIASVHAPIGVPINAETPAEIAVSIAAQLIQIRAMRHKKIN